MRHFLFILAIFYASGISIGRIIKIPFYFIYILAIVFLALNMFTIKKEKFFYIFLFCLTFILGITLLKNSQNLAPCHISKFIPKNKTSSILKGLVISQPQIKADNASFIFKVRQILIDDFGYTGCGNILIQMKEKINLDYGDELILKGDMYRLTALYRKRQSYINYLSNQGIYAIMRIKNYSFLIKTNKNRGFFLKRLSFWLKEKIEEVISKHTSPLAVSILEAMLLGEKRNIPAIIYNSMIKSGTVHILVVSGFNVGIVTFIVVLFLRLVRISRGIRPFIAVPLLIIYCLVTGASTPVVRATIMAIVFLLAFLFKREPDIYNSLGISAICILTISPKQFFDVGFQLSFASVIAIVYLYPKLKSFLRIESLKIKYVKFLIEGCLVSLSAWLGTTGLVAYYFKIFSPITVLANLFIVPLATLITLCGFSMIFVGLISPLLASLFASTCQFLVALLLNINLFLVKLPAAYFYLN